MQHIIALGFFDGAHLGHAGLLKRAKEISLEKGIASMALTFDRHPDEFVHGRKVPLLNTKQERRDIIKERFGIDSVCFTAFDDEIMHMPWEDFMDKVLIKEHGAAHLVVGHDFCFGYKGLGTAKLLKERCLMLGLGCDIIPEVSLEGVTVSSTHIRTLIAEGNMDEAARFLGYRHFIGGTAIRGRGIGKKELFATANITPEEGLVIPAFGVYATRVLVDGKYYDAVTNVGRNPTVGLTDKVMVESHILDFSGELYDKPLRVLFYRHLRPEIKFPHKEALKEQIAKDINTARSVLSAAPLEERI